MGLKNSSNMSIDESSGLISIVASSNQVTTSFQTMNCYMSAAIYSSTTSSTVANTVTETSLSGSGTGTVVLPSNFLTSGKTVKIRGEGYMGNFLTPTIQLAGYMNTVSILSTGVQTMTTITGTGRWAFNGVITCRTTGSTGTVISQGEFIYYTAATAIVGIDATNTTTTTIDTTNSQSLDLRVTWGTANGSNSITCTNLLFEVTV